MAPRHEVWHARGGDDSGIALMAAMGVATVGLAFSLIVIGLAVQVTSDSGRDRARTVQVHGAEGAVDTMYEMLQYGTPCGWPDATNGTELVNTSPDQTEVRVDVKYRGLIDAKVPSLGTVALTCDPSTDKLSGVPVEAEIVATAKNQGRVSAGVQPVRRIESKVQLTPLRTPGAGAAIYGSMYDGSLTNSFKVSGGSADQPAEVWIDDDEVVCDSNAQIVGRLYVPNSGIKLTNGCSITGDVRAKGDIVFSSAPRVGGNVWSFEGDVLFSNKTGPRVDGSVFGHKDVKSTAGGNPQDLIGGSITKGWIPPGPLKQSALPKVTSSPLPWSGFVYGNYDAWLFNQSKNPWASTASPGSTGRPTAASCTQVSSIDWGLNTVIKTPSVPTIFDATACTSNDGITFNSAKIAVYADTVLFVNNAHFTQATEFYSGDGLPHKLWIIDPDNSPGSATTCPAGHKGLLADNTSRFGDTNLSVFLYSHCKVYLTNSVKLYGQMYGKTVKVDVNSEVIFPAQSMIIPGADIVVIEPEVLGYRVDVEYKREIGAA